ncbi:hypothetical protein LA080_009962 [Diaporthe eres]|nr:hypothetical protein LA080_009962 [Diaporthe eres]
MDPFVTPVVVDGAMAMTPRALGPTMATESAHSAWLIEKFGDSVAMVQLPTDDGEGDEEQGQNVGLHPAKKGRNRQRAPGRVQPGDQAVARTASIKQAWDPTIESNAAFYRSIITSNLAVQEKSLPYRHYHNTSPFNLHTSYTCAHFLPD